MIIILFFNSIQFSIPWTLNGTRKEEKRYSPLFLFTLNILDIFLSWERRKKKEEEESKQWIEKQPFSIGCIWFIIIIYCFNSHPSFFLFLFSFSRWSIFRVEEKGKKLVRKKEEIKSNRSLQVSLSLQLLKEENGERERWRKIKRKRGNQSREKERIIVVNTFMLNTIQTSRSSKK